jgi:hypothetical protein
MCHSLLVNHPSLGTHGAVTQLAVVLLGIIGSGVVETSQD